MKENTFWWAKALRLNLRLIRALSSLGLSLILNITFKHTVYVFSNRFDKLNSFNEVKVAEVNVFHLRMVDADFLLILRDLE